MSKSRSSLVAIKSDLLEEMNTAVEETGLQTEIVDVATDGALQRLSL